MSKLRTHLTQHRCFQLDHPYLLHVRNINEVPILLRTQIYVLLSIPICRSNSYQLWTIQNAEINLKNCNILFRLINLELNKVIQSSFRKYKPNRLPFYMNDVYICCNSQIPESNFGIYVVLAQQFDEGLISNNLQNRVHRNSIRFENYLLQCVNANVQPIDANHERAGHKAYTKIF